MVVLKNKVKSCGCYHKDDVKNYNWTGYKNIPGRYWHSLITTAKKRNIEFNIIIKDVWLLYEKQA